MRYLSSLDSVHKSLVSCGVLTKNFWDMLKNAENSRNETLKRSVNDFVGFHDKVFNVRAEEAVRVLETSADQIGLEVVFSSEEMESVEIEFGQGELFDKIIQWIPTQPPRSALVVKEGAIDRETAVFKVWKNSYGVLTSDRFLHIFNEDPKGQFEQPVNSCVIHKASIIENEELYFEIIEAKQVGLLSKFAAPRRSVFKLHTLNEFLEWIRAIKQLL